MFYFGRALPRPCYAAAVNAPVITNLGCQGLFCFLHTPSSTYTHKHKPVRYFFTDLCMIGLFTIAFLRLAVFEPEACGRIYICWLSECSSTCALQIELSHVDSNTNNPFVNSHVWFKSRWIQQKALEFEQGGRGPPFRYMCSALKNYLSSVCIKATSGQ